MSVIRFLLVCLKAEVGDADEEKARRVARVVADSLSTTMKLNDDCIKPVEDLPCVEKVKHFVVKFNDESDKRENLLQRAQSLVPTGHAIRENLTNIVYDRDVSAVCSLADSLEFTDVLLFSSRENTFDLPMSARSSTTTAVPVASSTNASKFVGNVKTGRPAKVVRHLKAHSEKLLSALKTTAAAHNSIPDILAKEHISETAALPYESFDETLATLVVVLKRVLEARHRDDDGDDDGVDADNSIDSFLEQDIKRHLEMCRSKPKPAVSPVVASRKRKRAQRTVTAVDSDSDSDIDEELPVRKTPKRLDTFLKSTSALLSSSVPKPQREYADPTWNEADNTCGDLSERRGRDNEDEEQLGNGSGGIVGFPSYAILDSKAQERILALQVMNIVSRVIQ